MTYHQEIFVDFHRNLPKPASRLSPMTTTETLLTSKKEVTLIESLMNWKVYKKFDTFAVACYVMFQLSRLSNSGALHHRKLKFFCETEAVENQWNGHHFLQNPSHFRPRFLSIPGLSRPETYLNWILCSNGSKLKWPWYPTGIQMDNLGLYSSATVWTSDFGFKWIVLKVPTC